MIQKEFEFMTAGDADFIEKITTIFMDFCLEVSKSFQEIYKVNFTINEISI